MRIPFVSLALSLLLYMAGCSAGGSSDSGGIVGSGAVSRGPITATGSRVVAGTRWEVGSAVISSDGVSGFSEADLPLGRVVTIEGTRSADGLTGTASTVSFDSRVRGPADAGSVMDLGGGQTGFRIFGTAVVVDSATILDPPGLVIAAAQVLDVDGLGGANGELRATRVELREAMAVLGSSEIEVKGTARNASASAFELDLDGDGGSDLTVDLDSAPCSVPTQLEPSDLDLSTQPFVEVEGILTAATRICASEVELEDEDSDFEGDDFEIEGIVSSFVSLASFRVADFPVDASGAQFEPVALMGTLANGDRVEVEGDVVMGVLQADEVKARDSEARVSAAIANLSDVNPGAGTVRLLGILIGTDASTEFDGFSNLSQLDAGDFLEVEAFMLSDASLIASKIKNEGNSNDEIELRGPIEALNTVSSPRRITVLGVSFEADAPFTEFDDGLDANRFYDRARPGEIIEAKGCGGASQTVLDRACELEFED